MRKPRRRFRYGGPFEGLFRKNVPVYGVLGVAIGLYHVLEPRFWKPDFEANLPCATQTRGCTMRCGGPMDVVVDFDESGQFQFLGGCMPLSTGTLTAILRKISDDCGGPAPLVIHANAHTPWRDVVRALDAAKIAGTKYARIRCRTYESETTRDLDICIGATPSNRIAHIKRNATGLTINDVPVTTGTLHAFISKIAAAEPTSCVAFTCDGNLTIQQAVNILAPITDSLRSGTIVIARETP